MSHANTPEPTPIATPAWSDAQRGIDFNAWLTQLAPEHGLFVHSLRMASADASFRRYFRIDSARGSRIIMDAPPTQEDCRPFVKVAQLMHAAQVHAPEVLAWDEANGFMLLTDLGAQTMMQVISRDNPQANLGLYLQALDALIAWQTASMPGVLPPYDEALLRRELELFPDWYLARHRGVAVEGDVRRTLDETFKCIIEHNLAWPSVYVHRDFMPRNLMVLAEDAAQFSAGPPQRKLILSGGSVVRVATSEGARLGVLDFQDAVYGPITYDIASLMRDAFLS